MDFFTLGDLAERLKVSASIISEVLEYLKKAKWVEVRGPDPMNPVVTSLSLAIRHSLTDAGRRQAAQLLEYDSYAGPAPVVLKDYWRQVTHQAIGKVGVTPDRIQQALKELVLSAEILEQLGVAAVSGKPASPLMAPPETQQPDIPQRSGRPSPEDDIPRPTSSFVGNHQVIQGFDLKFSHCWSSDAGGLRGRSTTPAAWVLAGRW